MAAQCWNTLEFLILVINFILLSGFVDGYTNFKMLSWNFTCVGEGEISTLVWLQWITATTKKFFQYLGIVHGHIFWLIYPCQSFGYPSSSEAWGECYLTTTIKKIYRHAYILTTFTIITQWILVKWNVLPTLVPLLFLLNSLLTTGNRSVQKCSLLYVSLLHSYAPLLASPSNDWPTYDGYLSTQALHISKMSYTREQCSMGTPCWQCFLCIS